MQNKRLSMKVEGLPRLKEILSNKAFRKALEAKDLLTDYDVVYLTMDYMNKTGLAIEGSKEELKSFVGVCASLDAAETKTIPVAMLNSMEHFSRLTHAQALLLKNLERRPNVIGNIEPKKRKDKKLCARLQAEYENLWAILASRVVKNYYDFASTRDGIAAKGLTEEQYLKSEPQIEVGGMNLTKAMAKLYKNRVSKDFVVSNLPFREVEFKRQLPKIVKENKTAFTPVLNDIYEDLQMGVVSGRTYAALPINTKTAEEDKVKAPSKTLLKLTSLLVAGAIAFNSVAGPISQIVKGKEGSIDEPPVQVIPPNVDEPPVVVPPVNGDDKWGGNVTITDDKDQVAPNKPEENEKPADVVSPIPDDNDPENDTVVPDLQPGDDTNVFEPVNPTPENPENPTPENPDNPEKPEQEPTQPEEPDKEEGEVVEPDPGYDKPNDVVPEDNNTNNEKQEANGPVEDREDNLWVMD